MDAALLAGIILVVCIVVTLALGVPISVSVGLSSFLALAAVLGAERATFVGSLQMFTGINSFTLLAIPFFILAGSLMNSGGIAGRLIDAAKVLVGKMPGGLAATTVVSNALFGSVSGAAVASCAAVGKVMIPRMETDGYSRPFATATTVASAPSGMLIPPSNTLIVYSLVSSSSIAALFMAGYGPGIVWMLACLLVVGWYVIRRPELRAAKTDEHLTLVIALKTIWRAVPSLLMIVIVIGGILTGVFTPTESAVIAVLYSLVLGFIYREIRPADLPGIILDATRTTTIVMLLIGVSSIMSWVMSYSKIPESVASGILGFTDNPTVILILIMVILLILGTFMDPTPAILIFGPIFLPIVTELGVSPIHFGMMMTFNLCLGTITPPVGTVLFVGARVGEIAVEPVVRQMLPFFAALVVGLFIVVFVPQLSMWLPELMGLV